VTEPSTADRPRVAVFRPDDDRLVTAARTLEELGVIPVGDPMLAVEYTGAVPRSEADVTVFTSRTGVDAASEADWTPGGRVAAIGERTAGHLREAGYDVDVVPAEFSSAGLVTALSGSVDGARVEVARSDHGRRELLTGLREAGAYVHETVLYRLVRPAGAGDSTVLAARGALDAALFTSSLTVEHFLAAAEKRDLADAVRTALGDAVVGAIGEPTAETAAEAGIAVDVVPETATFEALATAVVDRLEA
jgi:uroporphyrinogen-III synthase